MEAARRQGAGEAFVGVIYVRKNTMPVGQCVDELELIAKVSDLTDFAGWVEYLPL